MQNAAQVSADTLRLIKEAQGNPSAALLKAYTQAASATSGITAYDLEAPAKLLFPVITPLRNVIPRVSGKGGIQANWRAVTGVNSARYSLGLVEGRRGGISTDTTADYTAVYKEMGLDQTVSFKAERAAEGFQDLDELAVANLLKAVMIGEEFCDLAGNTSLALGTTANAVLTQANTGGSLLEDTSYGVGVVALTADGYYRASLTGGVVQTYTRTNGDGTTDTCNGGTAIASTQANVTTANVSGTANTHVINATVTAKAGAFAYAWFWGVASGNLTLGAITTINSVQITATATGNAAPASPGIGNFNALAATDYSQDSRIYDGLLTMCSNSSLNSYRVVQATGNAGTGTPLTSDGAGGITEFDTALQSFWDNYRLGPDTIWVSSQEMKYLRRHVLTGATAAAQRFVFQVDQAGVVGGVSVKSYLNPFTMGGPAEIPIRLHPNVPPGTVLFTSQQLPYPMSNVTNVMQKRLRQDYFQINWPITTRVRGFGVYFDGVLQHYFPPSMGIITNIGAG